MRNHANYEKAHKDTTIFSYVQARAYFFSKKGVIYAESLLFRAVAFPRIRRGTRKLLPHLWKRRGLFQRYFQGVCAQPVVNVVYRRVDMSADNLAPMVYGLFLHIEQNAHIVVGSSNDRQNDKLHV